MAFHHLKLLIIALEAAKEGKEGQGLSLALNFHTLLYILSCFLIPGFALLLTVPSFLLRCERCSAVLLNPSDNELGLIYS